MSTPPFGKPFTYTDASQLGPSIVPQKSRLRRLFSRKDKVPLAWVVDDGGDSDNRQYFVAYEGLPNNGLKRYLVGPAMVPVTDEELLITLTQKAKDDNQA